MGPFYCPLVNWTFWSHNTFANKYDGMNGRNKELISKFTLNWNKNVGKLRHFDHVHKYVVNVI